MGKGEDELGVENLPHACYRLLKNRGLSLSVHFYMILPATLNTQPLEVTEYAHGHRASGSFFACVRVGKLRSTCLPWGPA
jgi:hypothetical protein